MLTYPDIPTLGWLMPRDVVARDVIAARRRERLLADVCSSRADFLRETHSRRRLLATLKPQPAVDPLIAEIAVAWQRLSADYHRSRKVNHYPGRKWRHGR
ncbi:MULTISPECIES: hypothetical protein [unclassified Rhizobium]|uniref:hypothetical protein n=1 Tax=unclassified Rhizobium TaxID=2613769 RepID=UPI0011AB786F|nr:MULTISPECIES: hypothetical protein [unclassified Rhizobium]